MTRPRILCVDDEQHVLDGLRDLLRKDFSVLTATSGEAGLGLVETQEPFVAVVSDMRMPGMNGSEFLTRVRRITPVTVRILLTGQADLDAAMAAVNDSQIFRFLLKPCPRETLFAALEAAVQQYSLVTAERVLLEETLSGAVQALTDVLALANPKAFGRASRLKAHAQELARELQISDAWELELAATLSQIGCITLPAETAEAYAGGGSLSDSEAVLIERLPIVGARILRHIPRLEGVHSILTSQNRSADDGGTLDGREVPFGARILRIVHDHDVLESRGLSAQQAVDTLRGRDGIYDEQLLEIFARMRGAAARAFEVRELPLRSVEPGMVFVEDVHALNGSLLVARGHAVTVSLLEKIRNLPAGTERDPVRVQVPARSAEAEAA